MIKKESALGRSSQRLTAEKFLIAMSLMSIVSLFSMISLSLFNIDSSGYAGALWIIIIGLGLLIESRPGQIQTIKYGLTGENLPHLVSLIIGVLAILTGFFSFPFFGLKSPGFLAVKGIFAIIAVIIIVIKTWIVEKTI